MTTGKITGGFYDAPAFTHTTPDLDACPTCQAPTVPQRRSPRLHPSYCATCTVTELETNP